MGIFLYLILFLAGAIWVWKKGDSLFSFSAETPERADTTPFPSSLAPHSPRGAHNQRNWIPPLGATCDVCYEPGKQDRPLRRCSTCKNQFYCSDQCQHDDWKEHRHNCSLLPSDTTKAIIPCNYSLMGEIIRLSGLLERWVTRFEKGDETKPEAMPESAELLDIYVRPEFSYSQKIPGNNPYRPALITICRLFLNHLAATLSVEGKIRLHKMMDEMDMPSFLAKLYGPKLIYRPKELSPGEYMSLLNVSVFIAVADDLGLDEAEKERWKNLAMVSTALKNVK